MNGNRQPISVDSAMLLPVNLLALVIAIMLGAMLGDTLRQRTALEEQIRRADIQGRKAVESRLHYYNLYKDLFELAPQNSQAAQIVRKYGIQLNKPPTETTSPPTNANPSRNGQITLSSGDDSSSGRASMRTEGR